MHSAQGIELARIYLLKAGVTFFCTILAGCGLRSLHTKAMLEPDLNRGRFATLDSKSFDAVDNPDGIKSVSIPPPMLPAPTLVMTPEVERELKAFLGRERVFIERALERRDRYMPMLQQIFKDEGIPDELLSLALIESGYNPEARSPVGAVGMWQFMRPTARIYGLSVKHSDDQRKDPILSSIAAARLLRDLYFYHGDWQLALAAYNAGSGGVAKALSRAGCDDYWTLVRKRKLTNQTSRFVPRFIAAAMITRGLKLGNNMTQLADNFEARGNREHGVEIADWSGDRHSSAG